MSIRRKGNRWEVRIGHRGELVERRLPPGASRSDAQALETAIRRRLIALAAGRPGEYTVAEAIERWRIDAQRLRSWQHDLRFRADVIRETVGAYHLERIVEAADQVKARGAAAGLKPASVNRYLALLKRLARLAYRWQWIERPAADRIELLPGEVRRTDYATPAQVKALLLAADPRLRDAILLAALTGLRRGELLAARPDWIDGGALVVPAAVSKTHRPRVVPLSPQAATVAARLPIDITAPTLRRLWELARTAAGLPGLRWHDLRRSFGTWLIQGGASLADARDLLGHGDVRTTSIYLATARQDLRDAVAALPRVRWERGGKKRAPAAAARRPKRRASG